MVKINNGLLVIILGSLLLVTFVSGILMSYNLGVARTGEVLCNPLTFGLTHDNAYTCFNETEQERVLNLGYNEEMSIGGSEWS